MAYPDIRGLYDLVDYVEAEQCRVGHQSVVQPSSSDLLKKRKERKNHFGPYSCEGPLKLSFFYVKFDYFLAVKSPHNITIHKYVNEENPYERLLSKLVCMHPPWRKNTGSSEPV